MTAIDGVAVDLTNAPPGRRCVVREVSGVLQGVELAEWLADATVDVIGGCDGLFVATTTAGTHESVAFWADVRERGPRFANPRGFPWTLASAPAGHLALRYAIRGPVVNLVGDGAAQHAVDTALDHLHDGVVRRAAIVAFDRDADSTSVVALALSNTSGDELRARLAHLPPTGRPCDCLQALIAPVAPIAYTNGHRVHEELIASREPREQ